jgi:hypothetical protein
MVDAAAAVLIFAVATSAIAFIVDALNYLRGQQVISRRLQILSRSDW